MKTVKLGDVCGTRSIVNDKNSPYVGMEDVESHTGRFLGNLEPKTVKSTTSYFDEGAVLYGKLRPYLNKVLVPTFEGHCSTEFVVLRPNLNLIDRKFLWYFLTSPNSVSMLNGYTTGTRMPRADLNILKGLEISLPTLEEQRRIVARLDAAFEKIDRAIELAEKNVRNTNNLFGSILRDSVKKNTDIESRSIGDIADIEYGLTEKSKVSGYYRLVRITDIDDDGRLKENDQMYVENSTKSEKYELIKGDLVVARTGATFGKVLYFESEQPSVFASYLIRINFKGDINPKLFWYYAKTPQYWSQANGLAGGAAQPQFNGGALKQVVFSYPISRTEQDGIVTQLDQHYMRTTKAVERYLEKIKRLQALKQSLLTQAFSQDKVN